MYGPAVRLKRVGIRDAIELGEDAIACSVNNTAAELADHWKSSGLMPFEVLDRARFVSTHESAIAGDVRCKDGCQSTAGPGVAIFGRHSRNPRPSTERTLAQSVRLFKNEARIG